MAKALLTVGGTYRNVKDGFITVGGEYRRIKSAYVTVDGVYRSCWSSYDPVFANNTWEQIAEACSTRRVPDTWSVGDQKTMTIGGTDYLIDIIGKDHDDYADGSGKAPLTFQLHNCYVTNYAMNTTATNNGSWKSSAMRNTHLDSILQLMPSAVQSAIRRVTKRTSIGLNRDSIENTEDKLFLLSEIEALGMVSQSFSGEGTQYEYYVNNSAAKLKVGTDSGIAWWLRSPIADSASRFELVAVSGKNGSQSNADNGFGVSFAFCF